MSDAMDSRARRLHMHLSQAELETFAASDDARAAPALKQLIERIAAVKRSPGQVVSVLRRLGRFDFSLDAWLAFADGRPLPRAASPDGTAALLVECVREQNEARASDVVKLMDELSGREVTVFVWTSIALALGLPRVAGAAAALAQRWLADDETIVPVRGYIWLGRIMRAAGVDATLAFERAKGLGEIGAEAALSEELYRHAWRKRHEGDVRGALALVRRAAQ